MVKIYAKGSRLAQGKRLLIGWLHCADVSFLPGQVRTVIDKVWVSNGRA